MKSNLCPLICALGSWLFALGQVFAQDANVIPFQGQLANQVGQVLSPTGAVTLVFRLYTAPVGGMALWEESQPNISVNGGRFSALLGSRTMLPAAPVFNSTLYLGITVDDGNAQTADVEMRPRQALVPVISARYAQSADKLRGYDWSVLFGTNNPADGRIQGSKIAAESITASQIASNTITAGQMAPQTITSAQIASNTITAAQIAPATIGVLQLNVGLATLPGTIVSYGGASVPANSGWLLCDGRAVSSQQYPDLYAAIGTNWGVGIQDSTNNFNLPDLRGLFLRGVNGTQTNALADPDRDSRAPSPAGGNSGNLVGSYQPEDFKHHQHPIYSRFDASAGSPYPLAGGGQNDPGSFRLYATEATGGSETRPKNAYVNYIIKY